MPIAATAALERHVKAKIMLGILVVAMGMAFGVAARSNSPMPPCLPDVPCIPK